MTDFATAGLTAAVQVTLAIVPTIPLVLFIGRRSAATAATLAAAAIIVAAGLSLSVLVPLPQSWCWNIEAPGPAPDAVYESSTIKPVRPISGWDVAQLLALLKPAAQTANVPGWSWQSIAASAIGMCAAISLSAWTLGVLSVVRLRRRSRPIHDEALLTLADNLKSQLGTHGPIELRSSSAIGSAATCGIRRPLILLADDWRTWSQSDLRAVLAHELAHIRRRDFGIGLVARMCLSINAYHPLAHWLVGRLRFAQELAADQLAARFVGGCSSYRSSLVRMALRQDRVWLGGIGQSFGSNRNSLLGRLKMLHVMDDGHRPLGRVARSALVGTVVVIGLAMSAVRGPAQPMASPAPATPMPPFDLGYLPATCDAFIAMRPGLLFGRPEMKPVLDTYTKLLTLGLAHMGLSAQSIPLDAIEQVIGPLELKKYSEDEVKRMPNGERYALVAGLLYVRMNRDFDWAAVIRSLPKNMAVTEKEPGIFEMNAPMFGPQPITVHVIDACTIVGTSTTASEAAQRRKEMAQRFGSAFLAEINRAGLAAVIDNRDARWTNAVVDHRDPTIKAVVAALDKPAHLAFCLHWNERVTASVLTDWDAPPVDVTRGKATICKLLNESLQVTDPNDEHERRFVTLATEMLGSLQVARDGNQVRAEMQSSMRWVDLLNAVMLNGAASVDVKKEKTEKK